LASVSEDPQAQIVDVARSSLGCTVLSAHKEIFAGLVADAVIAGKDSRGLDDIYIRAQMGGSPRDSRLVRGVALMREPIHSSMKKSFRKAKLLVVKGEFQIEKQGRTNYYDHNFRVETPEEYRKLLGSKRDILVHGLGKITECGADIILVEKGVDAVLVDYFVKRGMAVIRRFPPPEFDHVVNATGAMPVSDFHDISESDLVEVERAEYTKIGDTWWWLLEGFKNPRTCELLVRGADQMLFDEIQRVLKACFKEVKLYLESPALTYGGGWFEMMIARDLRRYALTLPGREQNVVEKVAEAFESIPSSLAESSGMDKLDAMIELRSRLSKNGGFYGIDCGAGRISDVKDLGLVEPLHVKVQALQSAFEAAFTLLRVDQVVRARKLSKEEAYYVERQEKTSVEALNKHQRDYGL
jgi:chaperonin GroEL (HSP60 family)